MSVPQKCPPSSSSDHRTVAIISAYDSDSDIICKAIGYRFKLLKHFFKVITEVFNIKRKLQTNLQKRKREWT